VNDDDERFRRAIREALRPVDDQGSSRDLWPSLLHRLEEREPGRLERPGLSLLDWLLLASVPAWALAFPNGILTLLYHL
jgi:hypothetical protein